MISTANLELVGMSRDFLAASLGGRLEAMRTALGATPAPEWPEDRAVVEMWFAAAPDGAPAWWGPRAVILRSERRMIGHAGFHGPPGQADLESYAPGGIELGYTIYADDRGRGFATEAARALLALAADQGVAKFVVTISPGNGASLAVARRLGFTAKVASRVDPDDGPVDTYVLDLNSQSASKA